MVKRFFDNKLRKENPVADNKRKDGNMAGGSSGGISNTLPILQVDISKQSIFPTKFFLPIMYDVYRDIAYEIAEEMCNIGHVVAVPVLNKKALRGGVLAEVRNLKQNREKKRVVLEIRPLRRIDCVSVSPSSEIRDLYLGTWQEAEETSVSPARAKEQDFVQKMILLFFAFNDLQGTILVSKNKSEVKYFSEASELIEELNEENLVEALDAVMTALYSYSMWGSFDLAIQSFIILQEKNVETRLEEVIRLLGNLIYHVAGDDAFKKDPDDFLEDDSREISPVLLLEDRASGGLLIQKDLDRPRKIERPPAIIIPERPHGRLVALDHRKPSVFSKHVVDFLDQYVVGQNRAKNHIARVLSRIKLGRVNPRRPVIGGIFCGPTSVGKTELVKALAKFMFGDFNGYTHISCNLLKERHEVAYLIGAPPGYIGHGDEPVLSQWRVDKPHFLKHIKELRKTEIEEIEKEITDLESRYLKTSGENEKKNLRGQITKKDKKLREIIGRSGYKTENKYSSMVLLDEIERAHPAFYESFLQVFDDGRLPLMNGDITDFSRTIFWMTSNIHGKEIQEDISGRNIGFAPIKEKISAKERFQKQTWKEVVNAVIKHFSSNAAFLARIGKENLVVFYPLDQTELVEIVNRMYLPEFLSYLKEKAGLAEFYLTDEAKVVIVNETQDPLNRALGARALQKVFERLIENPVLNLLARAENGDGIKAGDRVWIDAKDGEIVIFKEEN